jgi:N utilization substance protein A
VAVSSSDPRIDCVGACVGVRGNRIKNIVDELSGERIDIVRWNEDMQVLIPNALQPAEVDEVILCKMMGRAIVLVHDDQLSLAIGRRGQNVRLGSKLCKWDIEIMTREELEEQIERAVGGFSALEGVSDELAEVLVGEGFLSYDDLSVIEPDDLMSMGDLTAEQVDQIVAQAEEKAEAAEQAAAAERKRQRELERIERATAEEAARLEAEAQAAAEAAEASEQTPEVALENDGLQGDATEDEAGERPPSAAADAGEDEAVESAGLEASGATADPAPADAAEADGDAEAEVAENGRKAGSPQGSEERADA